jgi:hypothetical protein
VAAGLTVAGLEGERNWAPTVLTLAWLLLPWGWWSATGEPVDSDAGGEAGAGLRLATCAVLVITVAAALASAGRPAERGKA